MKHQRIWLAAALALLILVCAGSALAAASSLDFKMDLDTSEFTEPKTITVSFTVTNVGDKAMPGPMKLFYPDGKQVAEFGEPVLEPGDSRNWTGTWDVTKDELTAGKISFRVSYSDYDENGEVKQYALAVSKHIKFKSGEPVVEIKRTILPQLAQEGQNVNIIYEITNSGPTDVTGVTIQESANGKKKTSVGDIKSGEAAKHTFAVTMKKKDITSQATVTYKAGGKSYTSKVEAAVIKYGKVNLTATLSADRKGGVPGETVKLTLKLKNTGTTDFTDVMVTDEKLGVVFTGQTVKAKQTLTLEKELTITETQDLLFTVRGEGGAGGTVETATGKVTITAKDPGKQIALVVEAVPDRTEVDQIPGGVVQFKVTVTNRSSVDAENVSVKAGNATMYTFAKIPAGESRYFVRDAEISMPGTFQFTANVKDQVGETASFASNKMEIRLAAAPAAPTAAPAGAEKPEPKTEGTDVLDLTGYPLENVSQETRTRAELMNNGLLLVNEWHPRPDDFSEAGIQSYSQYTPVKQKMQVDNHRISMFPAAWDALLEALTAAKAEGQEHYLLSEGYRSWDTQNEMFQKRKEKLAPKYSNDEDLVAATRKEVNYPGTSEFNSGLSFTLRLYKKGDDEINSLKYSSSEQGIWMNENCWKYGLAFRFPEEEWPLPSTQDKSFITGVSVRLNLYRYVGKGNAAVMHYLDLCLEEYIAYLHEHPHIALYEDGKMRYEIWCQYVGDADSFTVDLTPAASYVSSLDNMGYVVTVFEH